MKKNITRLINRLEALYPEPACMLSYDSEKPYELLIAARLSAQCTDKRVNLVTPALFARFASLSAFAQAEAAEVEAYVRSCGLGKSKARDIVMSCRRLTDAYGGVIPGELDELLTLPGIGRKTANLLLGTLYGKPAVVADTHVIRLSNRLGLANTKDPAKVEAQLRVLLPPRESLNFCHRLVLFGRDTCKARNPGCTDCALKSFCVFVI